MRMYRIKHWDRLYENNRSRCIENLTWVSVPIRHDGEGYGRLMAEKNAHKIFSAWILMLQVAASCKPRGLLRRADGSPHTPESMSFKTRAPIEWFTIALPFLEALQWIESEPVTEQNVTPASGRGDEAPLEQKGIEQKGTEQDKRCPEPAAPASGQKLRPQDRIRWDEEKQHWTGLIAEDGEVWKAAYPAVDLKAEISKARAWVIAHPKQKKSDWFRFLNNWFKNSQERGGTRPGSTYTPVIPTAPPRDNSHRPRASEYLAEMDRKAGITKP